MTLLDRRPVSCSEKKDIMVGIIERLHHGGRNPELEIKEDRRRLIVSGTDPIMSSDTKVFPGGST